MNEEHTTTLLRELCEIGDSRASFCDFREQHAQKLPRLSEYLNQHIADHPELQNAPLIDIIRRSNLDHNYAYQILNGKRTRPDKYKLIALCIAMGMNLKDTDRALFLAGQPKLYPKKSPDDALIVCINRGYKNMMQVHDFFAQNGLALPDSMTLKES